MRFSAALLVAGAAALVSAAPMSVVEGRQSKACFLIGNTALPKEVSDVSATLQSRVTCSTTVKTLSGVPDVSEGGVSFSSIDFSGQGKSTLAFALDKFATAEPLASNDLAKFQSMLDVYTATEAGIRSVGGNLAIKVPKFFLSFQASRIATAQGKAPTAPGLQIDHLRDKVTKNAAGQDKALIDEVVRLATVRS